MKNSERLIYLAEKTNSDLSELWGNCFEGESNSSHMNRYVPMPVPNQAILDNFLITGKKYSTWLIKRIFEQDIIGFIIFGDFIPQCESNSIGFNIGLDYTRKGYAIEALSSLINFAKENQIQKLFGYCFEKNFPSIKTMEKCGFINEGLTGRIIKNNNELKFSISL